MKTRTKGFILSFILVFAMLIGVFTIMPMTASAAGETQSEVVYDRTVEAKTFAKMKEALEAEEDTHVIVYAFEATSDLSYYPLKYGIDYDDSDIRELGTGGVIHTPGGYEKRLTILDDIHIVCNDSHHPIKSFITNASNLVIDGTGSLKVSFAGYMTLNTVIYSLGDLTINRDESSNQPLTISVGNGAMNTHGYALWISNAPDSKTVINAGTFMGAYNETESFDKFTSSTAVQIDAVGAGVEINGGKFYSTTLRDGCECYGLHLWLRSAESIKKIKINGGEFHGITSRYWSDDSLNQSWENALADGMKVYKLSDNSLIDTSNIITTTEKLYVLNPNNIIDEINITIPYEIGAEYTLPTLPEGVVLRHYDWSHGFGTNPNHTNMEPGVEYRVVLYLNPAPGYTFSANPAVKINGKVSTKTTMYDENYTIRIDNTFEELDLGEHLNKNYDLGFTGATVGGNSCSDNESVKVPFAPNGEYDIIFTYKDLPSELKEQGYRLQFRATYYIDGKEKYIGFGSPVDNGDGTFSVKATPKITYADHEEKFEVTIGAYYKGEYIVLDTYTVTADIQKKLIPSANISVDTPVAGQTPSEVQGVLNTEGLTINRETWYEVNGSSLVPMDDTDVFVEGKQYKYEAFVFADSGYRLASDFYLKINESFASGNGGLWKMRTAVTAKAPLSVKASANVTNLQIKQNDYAQFVVEVNGGAGSPTYAWTTSNGAPAIVGATNTHYIDVKGTQTGTFTYTCTITDGAETKTLEFTLEVKADATYYAYVPDINGLVGTGNKNVNLVIGETITFVPDYVLDSRNYAVPDIASKTPRKGTISISWWIFTLDDGTGVHITADQLVVDDDVADYLNTSKTGRYYVQIEITNYVDDSEYGSARRSELLIIDVVEPEATGNLGGQIGAEQEQAIPYAMRKMSARSANNFEGTIVYLVKDEAIVYVTEADAQGYYMFTNIPYGSYSVKVEKEGYEEYNKPVEVNAAEVTHDVTIILHVCFNNEAGMLRNFPATQPICSDVTDGTLGNIEYYSCQLCGKFYDAERNLIADSANDPYSVNEFGVPYKAIIYPMHDYCDAAQEGGDADRYLRHRAETCLEDTTYWYRCINCHKSAGDDPMAVDKYYVGNASNQTHSYTLEIADEYYRYDFHELGVDGKENCKQKIWYYHACEYCYEKSPSSVWESGYYGAHAYGTLIPAQGEVHTPNELKAGVAAHYFCDVCDTYFDEAYIETTLAMLTGAKPEHSYTNEYGYKGADGHANTCSCGAKDTVVEHTPNMENPTETEDKKCTLCDYIIENKTGHKHTNHLTKVGAKGASCTVDGNIEYYTCSCGKWFTDATATTEITNKDSVVINAAHVYGTLIPQDNGTHTASTLKDGMKAHFFCDVCDTYFTDAKVATTKQALTITVAHDYSIEYGYKGADGHANTCSCGAKEPVVEHTPNMENPTETEDKKCTLCDYIIENKTGHIHTNHLTKVSANSASCTVNGNIEYYTCSCGKWFTDATATTEITNKDNVKIPAAHTYGNLIPLDNGTHTATELKDGMKAHYFCDVCDTYFDSGMNATTKAALTITNEHSYATEYGYKGADGHANTCSCGAKDTVEGHTPDRTAATETQPIKCTKCQYMIATELGHVHTSNLTKVSANSASCTADGNIEYYTCSCGKWFTDATATTEITIKDSVVIKAAHNFDNLIPAQDAVHTATELKGAVAAHYHCSCGAYFNEGKEATTLEALTGAVPTHTFVEGACECGATDSTYQPPHEHSFVEGKCECGETDPNYTPGTDEPGTDVPGTDEPGTDDPNAGNTEDPTDDNDGLPTGAIIAIVAGSVVVGGAGIFALVWFVIKKKTWAEFLAIFKKC